MNLEFHYYTVYALALSAGFSDSQANILASASQFVDTMSSPLRVHTSSQTITIQATQTYTFWNQRVQNDQYLPFHFLPGDPEDPACERLDGRTNPFSVSPNSSLAKELLLSALKSRDLYRIGIALHSFADSWAHQNFSGLDEDWNNVSASSGFRDFPGIALPAVGHLQALTAPDEPNRLWQDPRLVKPLASVDNGRRFRQAAGKVYRYLCVYNRRGFEDEELVLDRLSRVWRSSNREERLADYIIGWQMPVWSELDWLQQIGAAAGPKGWGQQLGYDKVSWLKHTVRDELGLGEAATVQVLGSDFYTSHLYHWHQAATEQRRLVHSILRQRGLL